MSAKRSSRSRQGSETSTRSGWSRPSTKSSTKRKNSIKVIEIEDKAEAFEDDHNKRRERREELKNGAKEPQQPRTQARLSKTGSERSRRSEQSKTPSKSKTSEKHGSRRGGDDHAGMAELASSSARSHSPPRHSSSHRRRSSPAELDFLVTPDDSISQVGANTRRRRPSPRRRSTHAKLGRIAEDEDDQPGFEPAQNPPIKRQSIFGALFGRSRRADDDYIPEYVREDHATRGLGRRRSHMDESDSRRDEERFDEELPRRMRSMDLNSLDDKRYARRRAEAETWGVGNAAGHLMNDDFVPIKSKVTMSTFGDAKMGRRGERASGRRNRPRKALGEEDAGLAPNFLGDQSVLGLGPFAPRASRHSWR